MKLVQEIGRLTTASEEVKRWGKGIGLLFYECWEGFACVLEKNFLELPSVVSEVSNV